MAEYINRDELFKHYRALANIEWNKTVAPISWCDAYEEIADHIAELPPADVVPKSEVEVLQGALKAEERHNELTMEMAKKALANAKQEVAREIFEEIEELAKIYTFPVVKNGVVEIAKEPFWCIEPNDLAKLKKKYTEETE